MKKDELISEFASKAGITKQAARESISALQDIVYSHINDDGGIRLFEGITVTRSWTGDRNGVNPRTGEPIKIAGHYRPAVKFGKIAKDAVNK